MRFTCNQHLPSLTSWRPRPLLTAAAFPEMARESDPPPKNQAKSGISPRTPSRVQLSPGQ